MKFLTTFLIMIIIVFSCSKEDTPNSMINDEDWEKFISKYFVYDSLGVYIYEINIAINFASIQFSGN